MHKQNTFEWKASLANTYEGFIQHMIEIMPQIIGAVGLLFVGWIVAKLLSLIARKAMTGLDIVLSKVTKGTKKIRSKTQKSYAIIVSRLVFWLTMLFFITAASNLLGWKLFAGWMDGVIHHLPNLIMGFVIILAGFIASSSMRDAVHRIVDKAGISNAAILALSFQIVIILTTVIIGVEQMGINVGFLTTLIAVITGILLAGGCLAFGLGAQTLVANIIGAQFARKHCRIGEVLKIGGVEGSLLEITQTSIILETNNGRSIVPAQLFQKESCCVENVEGR